MISTLSMFENRRHPTPKGRGRANTGQRDPNVPRFKAATATAQSRPQISRLPCMGWYSLRNVAATYTFKQHKSRLRTAAYQDYYGLTPTPAHERKAKPPPMMSQGPMHRRLVLARIPGAC